MLAIGTFALYATYSLSRYRQYLTAGYDLGIFDQAVHHYAQFRAPLAALKGTHSNLLGDHFHPILALLAPLYWVWDDARTLLLAQAALIAGSVLLVLRFCRRYVGNSWALVLAAGYALGWPLQSMADYDFHEVAFAVPLLAWAVDALDRRDDGQLLAAGLLLLLVREDMGLVLIVFGLLRALRAPRQPGLVVIAAGAAGYVLATSVAIPYFAANGTFTYWSYQALGPDLPSALQTLVFHPIRAGTIFLTPSVKTHTLLWMFAPLAFLPLRSPYVLPVIPLLAERFFSSRTALWSTEFHYTAAAWPLLFLATVDGARRLNVKPGATSKALLCGLLLAVPLVGMVTQSQLWPLNRLFNGHAFTLTGQMRDQDSLLRAIPAHTCVQLDDRLAAHLTHNNLVSLMVIKYKLPDFIALDLSQSTPGGPTLPTHTLESLAVSAGFRKVAVRGDLELFENPDYQGPSAACTP